MRLLVDACVARCAVLALRAAGHDAISIAETGVAVSDAAVLATARRQRRILITLDKDFGALVFARGQPHCGIVRLVALSAETQGPLCIRVLAMHATDLARGSLITVLRGRVRVRR